MKQVESLRVSKMHCNVEKNYQFKTKSNIYSDIHLFTISEQWEWVIALQITERTQGVWEGVTPHSQLQVRDKQDIIASLPLIPRREELLLAGNRRVHIGGMMIINTKQLLGTW